jgi:hypothetical protein
MNLFATRNLPTIRSFFTKSSSLTTEVLTTRSLNNEKSIDDKSDPNDQEGSSRGGPRGSESMDGEGVRDSKVYEHVLRIDHQFLITWLSHHFQVGKILNRLRNLPFSPAPTGTTHALSRCVISCFLSMPVCAPHMIQGRNVSGRKPMIF